MNIKQLPFNNGAEQSVLAAVFIDPKQIIVAADQLSVDDFFDYQHQLIFQAMVDLFDNDLKIDYQTVIAKLEENNNVLKAGGVDYIVDLSNHLPTAFNINSYIEIVLE